MLDPRLSYPEGPEPHYQESEEEELRRKVDAEDADPYERRARRAGSWAYRDGLGIDRNPYSEELQPEDYGAWRRGYMAAWERDR